MCRRLPFYLRVSPHTGFVPVVDSTWVLASTGLVPPGSDEPGPASASQPRRPSKAWIPTSPFSQARALRGGLTRVCLQMRLLSTHRWRHLVFVGGIHTPPQNVPFVFKTEEGVGPSVFELGFRSETGSCFVFVNPSSTRTTPLSRDRSTSAIGFRQKDRTVRVRDSGVTIVPIHLVSNSPGWSRDYSPT